MALITCPECGRENVSSHAESCPACGFNLKEHIAKEERKRHEAIDRELMRNEIKMPEKPDDSMSSEGKSWLFCAGIGFLGVLMFIEFPFLLVCCLVLVGFCVYMAFSENRKVQEKKKRDYELAQRDFEEYQNQMIFEKKKQEMLKELALQKQVKCPNCHSIYVDRISTASRVVSISMVGLASDKIGKQYKCRSCNHMW